MHKCKGPSVLFGCKIVRCSQEETVGSLTHYQMDYVSVEVTFSLCSPVLSGFRAPNFTKVSLQPSSTHLWLKPHPPINELAIVTALTRQPFVQTGGQHGHLWAPLWKHLGWLWVGHCCPPTHKWVEKTVLTPCTAPISGREAFIPVWASGCQLSAMTIAGSLVGGCGLSHKCVEDGCKSTCVKFGGWKPDRNGDMVSLIHVQYRLYPVMG